VSAIERAAAGMHRKGYDLQLLPPGAVALVGECSSSVVEKVRVAITQCEGRALC
jgi:hypothetical protein